MKKIIFLLFFVNISFPLTGNQFLKEYPFDKKWNDLTSQEQVDMQFYNALLDGYKMGNLSTLKSITPYLSARDALDELNYHNISDRTFKMKTTQLVRIVKKWCDDNPEKTHLYLWDIFWEALIDLPIQE